MRTLRSIIIGLAAVLVALLAPAAATAGGWAVINFDETPALVAGETTELGFVLLRHGETPEASEDLSFVLMGDGGRFEFSPVPTEGAVGHHTVAVTVPTSGSYELTVYGPFVAVELGAIDVAAASAASGGTSVGWNIAVWGSASLALLLAMVVIVDLVRRRPGPAVTADVPSGGLSA